MSVEAKDGNLVLKEINLPDGVVPGEEGVAEIDVMNIATMITPWDPDECNENNTYNGYKYRVILRVDGEEYTSGTGCIASRLTANEESRQITFTAPETSGTIDVSARIELAESGERTDWLTRRLEVYAPDEGGPADPVDDDDGDGGTPWGGGGGDEGDGDDEGSGNPFDDLFGGDELVTRLNLLVLAIGGLGAAYALGQLFDIQIGGGA